MFLRAILFQEKTEISNIPTRFRGASLLQQRTYLPTFFLSVSRKRNGERERERERSSFNHVKGSSSNVGVGSRDLYERPVISVCRICRFPWKIIDFGKYVYRYGRHGSKNRGLRNSTPRGRGGGVIWEPWEGCQAVRAIKTEGCSRVQDRLRRRGRTKGRETGGRDGISGGG